MDDDVGMIDVRMQDPGPLHPAESSTGISPFRANPGLSGCAVQPRNVVLDRRQGRVLRLRIDPVAVCTCAAAAAEGTGQEVAAGAGVKYPLENIVILIDFSKRQSQSDERRVV